MNKVAIVGGCGRLGLRLSLVLANKGHNVISIDLDDERITEINQGALPFTEAGADIYLEQALKKKSLVATSDNAQIKKADIVVITLGTPVDSNLNPSLEPVAGVIFDIAEYLKKDQLIVFRNSLYPGITKRIKTLIEDKTNLKVGKDIYLVFAPELENEVKNIHDLANAPQPIGAFDEKSFEAGQRFFKTITKGKISFVSPEEALLSKLMNNMYEYIQAAAANEFYLIAETFGANVYKALDASYNYRNLHDPTQIPQPNPNAAGPGKYKEGWYLLDRIPFTELITMSFKLNESMPSQIVKMLENYNLQKVVILGMTNKPNSDDARASLGYKLRRALFYKDYIVCCYDPYLPEYSDSSVLIDADAVILMTPHDEFNNLEKLKKIIKNPNLVIVDLQGFWQETKEKSKNGVWQEKVKNKSQKK